MTPRPSARAALLLLLLLAAACRARPALPDVEDELEYLEEDLEDLQSLEDGRAVDEAYQRLFGAPTAAARPPIQPAPDDYDGEVMQGDQPQSEPADAHEAVNASSAPADSDQAIRNAARENLESPTVERDRNLRVQVIKEQILDYLGLSGKEHPIRNSTKEAVNVNVLEHVTAIWPSSPPQDVFAEKMQSHYPSCSVPRNTDETLWSGARSGKALHLLFDLPSGPPPAGTSVNIMQATLRLYKLGNASLAGGPRCLPGAVEQTTPLAADGDEDAADIVGDRAAAGAQPAPSAQGPLLALLNAADEREVHVSVYWYTRSLRKNRSGVLMDRRKLLDSRMVPVQGAFWTEWSVRPAARVWRASGRNFGLAVEVEDEDGRPLDAHQFFSGMDCSLEASSAKPLPSFLLERLLRRRGGGAGRPGAGPAAYAFNQNLFPVMDLRIVETSDDGEGGALYSSGYHLAGSGSPGPRRSRQHLPSAPRHRHRHQHEAHTEHAEHADQGDDGAEPEARRWPRAQAGADQDDAVGAVGGAHPR